MLEWLKKALNILGAIRFLVGLIGPIKELVEAFETPGNGEAKKQAVLDVLREGIKAAEGIVPGFDLPEDVILNFAGKVIDVIVAFYNLTGKFQHSGQPGNAQGAA